MTKRFTSVCENVVVASNGVYYLRAKVSGKCIYRSLETEKLNIAKLKRNSILEELRNRVTGERSDFKMEEVLEQLRNELCDRPNIAPKTKDYGAATIAILRRHLPLTLPGHKWTAPDAALAWSKIATAYSPSVANKALSALKRLAGILIENKARTDDPTLRLKRMPTRKKHLSMPSLAQIQQVIDHVRRQKKRLCVESSQMIAVLAFSGMRVGESTRLGWLDVEESWIIVGRDGNTKSKRSRQVPLNGHLRQTLDAIRLESDGDLVLRIHSPRRALRTACAAVGIPPMRVHDLRHFFATWCIESGVDIPTVAKWLGHQDGGALCMRTYGHVRDDHSLKIVGLLG
jgi:integrase